MTLSFEGRTVIITGAGAGMGRSHARLLASRGARVVVNDIQGADEVVAELRSQGAVAVSDSHDISDPNGAAALVRTAVDSFGDVHGVVNNAGIAMHTELSDVTPEVLDRTMRVNAYGSFFMAQSAWPHLARTRGRLVMTASQAAVSGSPNLAHYASSKGAVLGMTRALAAEGALVGIGVNAVLPSAFTSMSRVTDGVAGKARRYARMRLAEDLGIDPEDEQALEHRSTAAVSVLVAWLLHPQCESNGEFFRINSKVASRTTYATSRGVTSRGMTIETARDNFDLITEMSDPDLPAAMTWYGTSPS